MLIWIDNTVYGYNRIVLQNKVIGSLQAEISISTEYFRFVFVDPSLLLSID
jgi:hypothetical protein